jgi:hypothetical protein
VLFTDVRAAPEGDEGQLLGPPPGAGGERLAERREDRQIDDSARLLIPKLDRAILLNVLAAEPRRVANSEPRIEEDRIDKSLVRAERIGPLEFLQFLLTPCLVAVLFVDAGLFRLEALDPFTGSAVDVASADRPGEEVLERRQDRVGLLGVSFRASRASMMTDVVMSSVS